VHHWCIVLLQWCAQLLMSAIIVVLDFKCTYSKRLMVSLHIVCFIHLDSKSIPLIISVDFVFALRYVIGKFHCAYVV
jgi:hypothetical protein